MVQNKKQKQTKLKKKLPRLFLILIVVVGLIISIVGIYLVSQQKRVKELNLQKELTDILEQVRISVNDKIRKDLEILFSQLSLPENAEIDGFQYLIEEIKKKSKTLKYIKNPLLINGAGELVFPGIDKQIMPLAEEPDEFHLFRQIKLGNIFLLERGDIQFTTQVFLNNDIQYQYQRGLEAEFKESEFKTAIKLFKKAVLMAKNSKNLPVLYNAMARCYVKLKEYKRAVKIYLMVKTRFRHLLVNDLEYLKIRILRQLAVASLEFGDQDKAIRTYLSFLDLLLTRKKCTFQNFFVFFKYEAIDFLHHRDKTEFSEYSWEKLELLKDKENLSNHSVLDNKIKGLLKNPKINSKNRREKVKKLMNEVYIDYNTSLLFYSRVNWLIDWEQNKDRAMVVIEPETSDVKKKYSFCFKNLQENTDKDPLFFGFIFDQKRGERDSTLLSTNKDLVNRDFKIQFADKTPDPKYKYPVVSLQFKNFYHWNSLILYSKVDDYLSRKVRKEIWINYSLIALLILTFILFISLFYKYISREAELLRLKSNFVDSVSHTLKTPLTRISLLAENVASDWVKDEEQKKDFLKTIILESAKMNEMINNMLNFSKIDAGKKQYDFQMGSVSEVVQSLAGNYSEYIEKLGFELSVNINQGISELNMDREAITLIVINLLQNALKYSNEEKIIRIDLSESDGRIVLEVEDHGMGISQKEQKNIFEKYYRTQNKKVRALEGSGLGLYLVKNAVKAHGGEIKVTSKIGKGSVFTVILPVKVK